MSDQTPASLPASGIQGQLKPLLLRIKFFIGSLFYLTYAPQAYWYSFRRDRLERDYLPPPVLGGVELPGLVLRVEATAKGALFHFEQAELEVVFLKPDLVRLTWQPGLLPVGYAVESDTISQFNRSNLTVNLEETSESWLVTTDSLRLVVGKAGAIQIYDAAGALLREEVPPQRKGDAWSHQAKLRPEESLYGLGERAARLNLRSPLTEADSSRRTYRMWNYDAAGMYGTGSDPMYICIPVYIGLHQQGSYLVFYENSFEATLTIDDAVTAEFTGGALRYYVAAGSPAQLLERYTELTGRAPLPPQWALGYHQSRWGYRTEAAVRETVHTFQDLDLPLSAIHLDIDVQVGFRAFTIDPSRFPQLGKFTQELAADGVQFITIINPGIKDSRKSKLFLEGQMLDAFCKLPDGELIVAPVWCGWSVFPDFTNPPVRQWWSRQYEFLLDLGVAGFWHDMNEPAAFIAWGDRSLPKVTRHAMEGRGGDHREAHNLYGLLQARAGYESLCQYRPHQRPFIVSRSGWAGLQRYAWTWTGDVECTWEALRQTIATVVGLGLSGVPYSGPDIGGFQGNPSAELYLRWFQLATFLPFYRSHCSNNVEYRAPWTYGEPYLSIIREFLKLRYRLMPYLYTLAWDASRTGHPLIRPLFWDHPTEASLWQKDDAFYLGDALLVCPVLQEGTQTQQVTLPSGKWYSFWNDAGFEGSQKIDVEVSLDTIPLFVKAGSVIPMSESGQFVLHLYPPVQETSDAEIYSDAGDGYGASRIDCFKIRRYPDGLELLWEQQGDYAFTYQNIQVCLHGFQVWQIWMDGAEVKAYEEVGNKVFYTVDKPFKQVFFKGEVE